MGGRICLDRAHLAHTDTETVIRQAPGRSRGSEEEEEEVVVAVVEEERGADEWGEGKESCATLIQDHSKIRAD